MAAGLSGNRILVRVTFSVPVQTGPEVHPVSCVMGTGSFQGVKRPGRGTDNPQPLATRFGVGWSCTYASALCLHGHVVKWP
jgi:hypothetical protein